MAYQTPPVGTILPAQPNTTVQNPGPVHDASGNTEFLQADAQDKAYLDNLKLIEQWKNAQRDNPPGSTYAANLGNSLSWAIVVQTAEAGGVNFDKQRVGPAVNTLES